MESSKQDNIAERLLRLMVQPWNVSGWPWSIHLLGQDIHKLIDDLRKVVISEVPFHCRKISLKTLALSSCVIQYFF